MQVPSTTSSCQQAGCSTRSFGSRAAFSGRSAHPHTGLSVCLSQPSLARRSSTLAAQSTAVKVERPQEANRARLQQIFDAGAQLPLLSASPSQDWETLYKLSSFSSQLSTAPPKSPANAGPGGSKDDDFYANVGNAIRTLRAEIPRLFQQDFTCEFTPLPSSVLVVSTPSVTDSLINPLQTCANCTAVGRFLLTLSSSLSELSGGASFGLVCCSCLADLVASCTLCRRHL